MRLMDDPRLTPLHIEDREFVGSLAFVLASVLLSSLVWLNWQGRPPTQVDTVRADFPVIEIDVNQAAWPELALMPGIGEVLARRIVRYRETNGQFESLDELDEVKGIGPKVLSGLRPLIRPLGDGLGES